MKKTTVYLSDEDQLLLRKKATIWNVTIAEALRMAIKKACQPESKKQKALWDTLDEIWTKTQNISAAKIEKAVSRAVSEVRSGKKK